MSRFLRELRYFWSEVRNGYPRQRAHADFCNIYAWLMSLELPAMGDGQCLRLASVLAVDDSHIALLFAQLKARVGRWNLTRGKPPVTQVLFEKLAEVEEMCGGLTPLRAKIIMNMWLRCRS